MEGASVTVREAMVLGVPVVAADTPGVVESLGGHGWVFEGDDPAAARREVLAVLNAPEKTRVVTAAARESALRRFSIRHTVEGTLAVYDAVVRDWTAHHGRS